MNWKLTPLITGLLISPVGYGDPPVSEYHRNIDGSVDANQIPMREAVWMLLAAINVMEKSRTGMAKRFLTSREVGLSPLAAGQLIEHARTANQTHEARTQQDLTALCDESTRAKGSETERQVLANALRDLQEKDDRRREEFMAALTSLLDPQNEAKVLEWAQRHRASIKMTEFDAPRWARSSEAAPGVAERLCNPGRSASPETTVGWKVEPK